MTKKATIKKEFKQGAIAILPLCLAVTPWGMLAGSFAIDVGMNIYEAIAMSAVLFAGSVQLVSMGIMKAGGGLIAMLLATFFVTSRHFLYGLTMRNLIEKLNLKWRLALGFLLTDEMFAICCNKTKEDFSKWYALGAGLTFYLAWNGASLIGIIAGSQIPDLNQYGLDFAVAATFIAIVVPNLKNKPMIAATLISLFIAVFCKYTQIESGLIFASIGGMITGYLFELKEEQ